MEGEAGFWVVVVGVGTEGCERPNRSFEAPAEAGLDAFVGGLEAKLKSPKSSLGILSGFDCGGAVKDGLDAEADLAADFGVVSKKPPPLSAGEVN